jgi:hypothetical protein
MPERMFDELLDCPGDHREALLVGIAAQKIKSSLGRAMKALSGTASLPGWVLAVL